MDPVRMGLLPAAPPLDLHALGRVVAIHWHRQPLGFAIHALALAC